MPGLAALPGGRAAAVCATTAPTLSASQRSAHEPGASAARLPPPSARIPVTFIAVLIALGITGWASARLGGADPVRATQRVVIGGAIAMAVTYAIGRLVGGVV